MSIYVISFLIRPSKTNKRLEEVKILFFFIVILKHLDVIYVMGMQFRKHDFYQLNYPILIYAWIFIQYSLFYIFFFFFFGLSSERVCFALILLQTLQTERCQTNLARVQLLKQKNNHTGLIYIAKYFHLYEFQQLCRMGIGQTVFCYLIFFFIVGKA